MNQRNNGIDLKQIAQMHPADIAGLIRKMDHDERSDLFAALDYNKAAQILSELDPQSEYELLRELSSFKISKLIEKMPPDEAADILSELSSEKQKNVLNLMTKEGSKEVQQLLKYDEESAGGLMTTNFLTLNENLTASRAIEALRQFAKDTQTQIVYVYILNDNNDFIGVMPIKKLISAAANARLHQLVNRNTITVDPELDQEEVAHIVSKYNLLAVPVVDKSKKLLGIITVDDVIDVIKEEDAEDIYRMAGISHEEIYRQSAIKIVQQRLPWLVATLIGGIIVATLIRNFQTTLQEVIALAFFIPVITGMGGNVGIQSSTMTVRGLATGNIDINNFKNVIFKELRQALIMGVICGLVVGVVAYLFDNNPILGLVLTIAMFTAILVAASIGVLVPLIFEKIKIDPAIASGPFITTANDITGVLIYFLMATWLFGLFT
jgi:magnesium transporter